MSRSAGPQNRNQTQNQPRNQTPLLRTRGLTKRFGAVEAVSDVSLEFEPGLIHAVLGENGAGKSTLMKLLFGMQAPTSGEILIDGEPVMGGRPADAIHRGLGMVQQHFTLVDPLSAIDNIMLGAEVADAVGRLDRDRAIARLEALLPDRSLCVPWRARASDLSVGEKQRVEILKLLFREARVLFLDEPTAVLAPQEVEAFFEVLRGLQKSGRTIVLITHKIGEVFQVCDTYAVLRAGRLTAHGRITDTNPGELVERMIGRVPLARPPLRAEPRSALALECRDVRERGVGRGRAKGLTFDVRAGEIVGVAGLEGSGQTSIVDAIMGLRPFDGSIKLSGQEVASGDVGRARALGCGLVPEDRLRQAIWPEASVRHNMIIGLEASFADGLVLNEDRIAAETVGWARDFDVRCAHLGAPIASLSGGNQQKAVFARETIGRKPALLVCHQPTRGVDLGAVEMIHARLVRLRNEGLGVLYLSSELDDVMSLCDRILVFFEGCVVAEFPRPDFDRLRIGFAMTGAPPSARQPAVPA